MIIKGIFTTSARDFSPEIGRFNSMDELKGIQQAPLTLNWYLNSNADLLIKIDPNGYMVLVLLANMPICQLLTSTITRLGMIKIMATTF